MKKKLGSHTALTCSLIVGERVRVEGWGAALDGKICTITDIVMGTRSQSLVSVKLHNYPNYIDSDWIVKISPESENKS